MDNHFSRFRVQNFKCFDDLTLDNLGLINIIVGDNNVGKTSLLEALLFTEEDNFHVLLHRWAEVLQGTRNLGNLEAEEDFIDYYKNRNIKDWKLHSEIKFEVLASVYIDFKNKDKKIKKYQANFWFDKVQGNKIFSHLAPHFPFLPTISPKKVKMPYMHFHKGYGHDLIGNYTQNIQFDEDKRSILMQGLQILVPKLHYIEVSRLLSDENYAIVLKQEGYPTLPLAIFGEGTIKLFRLLMEIIEWSHQRLMIDEIETGMHHSRMIPFWQAVLNTAYSQDTQLFATTHSLECLQKLHEVLEKPENEHLREKVCIIKLANTAKKGIQAYIYPYENFEYSLENDIEIR